MILLVIDPIPIIKIPTLINQAYFWPTLVAVQSWHIFNINAEADKISKSFLQDVDFVDWIGDCPTVLTTAS